MKIYNYVVAVVLGVLVLRNLVLRTERFVSRRNLKTAQAAAVINKKGSAASSMYGSKPAVLGVSDAVDSVFLRPVGVWPLSPSWTWFRFLMVLFIGIGRLILLKSKLGGTRS
jgi:hypothetical protein